MKISQNMHNIYKEFKEFAVKGNVMDMAVGIIIGAAFGKIVSSFVSDIVMPPIGYILGNVDFSDLAITLREATEETERISINYGAFLNNIVDFTIIALAIFVVIKQINRLKKKDVQKEEKKTATPPEEILLLREIRDSLKK